MLHAAFRPSACLKLARNPLVASASRSLSLQRATVISCRRALNSELGSFQGLAQKFRATLFNNARAFHSSRQSSSQQVEPNASSQNSEPREPLPILPSASIGGWLMLSSTLVFAVVVVGGITRLTESGLSITEWRPVTGILPPLSHDEWMVEFNKYKATPEFKLLNHSISLDDFKFIFYMEWGHRVLGRLIGLTFVIPLGYFIIKKQLPRSLSLRLSGLALLIGAQGAMGWYMVKSGLEETFMDTPGAVPRVSQYRLAAHLGLAFLLYLGMFGTGMAIIKDRKFANGAPWSGFTGNIKEAIKNPLFRSFKGQAWALTGLVLLTALSGAFVAGLDAGLVYNEFPYMGENIVPPTAELFSPDYAKNPDKSDIWWRNIFENPTTVQFNHRVLATSTYLATAALYVQSLRPAMRAALPPLARLATTVAFAMANVQVILGLTTLLYLVPVPLAALHQAGSVMLLSAMVHVLIALRRPSAAARAWRALAKTKTSTKGSSSTP